MIDVHLPTTDGRELVLTRYTQPERELQLLIQQLSRLPKFPPPSSLTQPDVVKTFSSNALINNAQNLSKSANPRRRVISVA
jgi:hypothetical protein